MQDISSVLTEIHEIESTLHVPINASRRIKYTCLATSQNYVALGSTSGSIYVFSREPCSYLYLIPLSEGIITQLQISPDEKIIALATDRGTVCLVALKQTGKLIGISNEHFKETIECLCWNENSSEVYIGDATGKVSVVVNSIFTVHGMFQLPSCSLMVLDSSIVQMSFDSSLLLISTLNHCYLCNTSLEQYKKIGDQIRNGEFGACFYKIKCPTINNETKVENKVTLRTFDFISNDNNEYKPPDKCIKIFCARPGFRLWEVDTNGTVVKTRQFKNALDIPPQPIYKLHHPKSLHFEKTDGVKPNGQHKHFTRLFTIQRKFLFTWSSTGLYFIDPINALVVLWNDEVKNIKSLSILDEKIYLMTRSGSFHCLSLFSVDNFILKLYEKKLFRDCLQAASVFKPHILGNKELDENELEPIIQHIKSDMNLESNSTVSGIVVVNSGVQSWDSQDYTYPDDILTPININDKQNNISFNKNNEEEIDYTEDEDYQKLLADCEIIHFRDHKGCSSNPRMEALDIVVNKKGDVIDNVFDDLIRVVVECHDEKKKEKKLLEMLEFLNELEEKFNTKWFERQEINIPFCIDLQTNYRTILFMEHFCENLIEKATSISLIETIDKFFVEHLVVTKKCGSCKSYVPEFHWRITGRNFIDIGVALLKKYKDVDDVRCLNLCVNVPPLWIKYIQMCDNTNGIHCNDDYLKSCLQTRDKDVLAAVLKNLDKAKWETVIKCVVKRLGIGKCVFCGLRFTSRNLTLNWEEITREINAKDGPAVALKFMYQVNECLPNVSFNNSLLRQLIFTKILHCNGIAEVVDFNSAKDGENHAICSTQVRNELIPFLEKDVNVIIDNSAFGIGSHHWGMKYSPKSSTCPCCTLSLQTPVLLGNNGIALFSCGHAYHVNCMIQKKITRCNLHTK